METKIKWNEGDGYITATYEGSGSGSASISSDVNEGIDREQSIKVETTDKSVSATLVVSQEGLREVFLASDGDFVLADGGTFNVLKGDEGLSFPITLQRGENGEVGVALFEYLVSKYKTTFVTHYLDETEVIYVNYGGTDYKIDRIIYSGVVCQLYADSIPTDVAEITLYNNGRLSIITI